MSKTLVSEILIEMIQNDKAAYGDEVVPIASKARDHIAKKMSKRQIDWAKILAADWIAKHKIERNEK